MGDNDATDLAILVHSRYTAPLHLTSRRDTQSMISITLANIACVAAAIPNQIGDSRNILMLCLSGCYGRKRLVLINNKSPVLV